MKSPPSARFYRTIRRAAVWDQGLAVWLDGDYCSLASIEASPAQVATIGEAWPGMGLASWFIAYVAAPEDQVPAMQSQKQIMAICTSTAAQYAALEASSLFDEAQGRQLAQLSKLRRNIAQRAGELHLDVIAGDAANVLALRSPESTEAAIAQLRQAGYEVANGDLFGAPDVIRLNVSAATVDALQALS